MKKGDKELQPGVPLQGRELAGQAGDGSHVCWGQGAGATSGWCMDLAVPCHTMGP